MGTLIINPYLNAVVSGDFTFTVKTDNTGTSNNDQFTLATRSGYTYDYTIDWGDGTVESYSVDTQQTHTYSSVGEYEIKISGTFPTLYYNNGGDVDKIISIENIGGTWGNTLERAFSGANNILSIDKVGDTSGVTNFSFAWLSCSGLTSFPLLDTSSGTSFSYAWGNCTGLTSFSLLDTSSGTTFYGAWQSCTNLTSFPLIDTSSGTDFGAAWNNCSSLTSLPLLDTSNGTSFAQAWQNCSSLTSFPLIDTSNGTTFYAAWFGCSSLTSFPANFFDSWTGTPVNNCFLYTWDNCTSLTAQSVENILVSIDTSGRSAPGSGTEITIDYNVGTGSLTSATNTAITNLKAKGWTPRINGVLV